MMRTLFFSTIFAFAALSSIGCDKRQPQNVTGADFTLKTEPAVPFHLADDAIVLPLGVAALVHVHVHGTGPGNGFDMPVTITPTNPEVFSYTVYDLGNNDYIFYGYLPGLTTLKIRPADTSNGDGGEACIPVAVVEQDGFLVGESDAGADGSAEVGADSGAPIDSGIDSGIDSATDASSDGSSETD